MILPDLAAKLQTAGIGTRGTDLFLAKIPADPDNIVVLIEYGGQESPLEWDGEYPSVNVHVRNTDYGTGRAKIESIRDVLHGLHDEVLSGTRYLLISEKQPPESLGQDDRNRWLFSQNFEIIKEK